MAQLICKDVSLGYEGKSIAQDINFEVNKGDYLCIVCLLYTSISFCRLEKPVP